MIKVFTNKKLNKANAYLVINDKSNTAILIDTAAMAKDIIDYLNEHKINLENIILTHGHIDHIKDLDLIIKAFSGVTVWMHKKDNDYLYSSKKNASLKYAKPWTMEYSSNVKNYIDDISVKMCDFNVNIRYMPGHTHGSCFIEVVDLKLVFIGDTVFINGNDSKYGRRRYFQAGTNPSGFNKAMKYLNSKYSDEWKIYPGHYDYGFDIKRLREVNKDFRKKYKDKKAK